MKVKIKLPNLEEIKQRLLTLGKNVLTSVIFEFIPAIVMVTLACIVIVKSPEIHNKWIRSKVGSRVYYIRTSMNSGGGTGSAVMAPSGETYILTNDHVCDMSKDGTLLISNDDGDSIRRRIIAHDENSDLCLIEAPPGVKGLQVAKNMPSLGDTLTVVGHPKLLPLHISKGEMMGLSDTMVGLGPISVVSPITGEVEQVPPSQGGILPDQCQMNKHKQVDLEGRVGPWLLKLKFCAILIHDAYVTNVIILPGNSGSPVVNNVGQVVGVAFAASPQDNWGRMISLDDIKSFLKEY